MYVFLNRPVDAGAQVFSTCLHTIPGEHTYTLGTRKQVRKYTHIEDQGAGKNIHTPWGQRNRSENTHTLGTKEQEKTHPRDQETGQNIHTPWGPRNRSEHLYTHARDQEIGLNIHTPGDKATGQNIHTPWGLRNRPAHTHTRGLRNR
jgi:hypothetical protein